MMLRHILLLGWVLSVVFLAQATADEPAPADPKVPGASAVAGRAPRKLPGFQPSGKILLPTQWSLQPAGKQLKLGDFPVNIALHPTEPWAAILHAGYGDHEVVIVDLKKLQIVSRALLPQTFCGLCFDVAGDQLFASGGEHSVVHRFKFAAGYLSEHREMTLGGEAGEKLVPAGLATSPDGKSLYVAVPGATHYRSFRSAAARPAGTASRGIEERQLSVCLPAQRRWQAAVCQPVGSGGRGGVESGESAADR